MSDAIFPTLPGVTWNRKKVPMFRTKVQEMVSGREFRGSFMAYPLWKFTLAHSVLRSASNYLEMQTMVDFFLSRKGKFDSFLYTDPTDNSVTAEPFGAGNGTTTAFQLIRKIKAGGFAEPVLALNGAPLIYVAGVLKTTVTHYNISATGMVTFTAGNIPTAGQAITWTGSYYYRVRFLQDDAEFNEFLYQLFELKKLEFRTVKP